ncbi:hypothetical protein E4U53_004193 [Claviceps sorghi]|nr:hypothetical protein E4U53_004193 [Claviceps sorghi]
MPISPFWGLATCLWATVGGVEGDGNIETLAKCDKGSSGLYECPSGATLWQQRNNVRVTAGGANGLIGVYCGNGILELFWCRAMEDRLAELAGLCDGASVYEVREKRWGVLYGPI